MTKVKYFDDMACRKPKFLGPGYGNIYVVRMLHHHKDIGKREKCIVLPYGSYPTAQMRYSIESGANVRQDTWILDECNISVETYLDGSLVHSDVLFRVRFGKLPERYAHIPANMLGEVLT